MTAATGSHIAMRAPGRRLLVKADSDPQIALRVLGFFAQVNFVPNEARFVSDGAILDILIVDDRLDEGRSLILLDRIRRIIGVISAEIR